MQAKAKLTSRRSRVTAYVEAEVDVSINDISTEDLIAELDSREGLEQNLPDRIEAFPSGTMLTVLELLQEGRADEAMLFVHGMLFPKWKHPQAAEREYKAAVKAAG